MIFSPRMWQNTRIAGISWHNWRDWLLRAAILILVISPLRAGPPRPVTSPPQTVQTTQPLLCMHTRLIDEVDEWKIQRSLQLVRELGAATIVEFFPWAYLEPEEGRFDWQQADRIVAHAENQGIRVIARLGLVPAWARPSPQDTLFGPAGEDGRGTTLNYLEAEHFPDFARFVAAFASRYAGRIDRIIIWNEPNLTFEWGYRMVSPAGYVDLLRQSYTAAKAANPDVIVLAAPLAPTLEAEGSPWGLDDLVFLEQMYAAGAAPYFDALAVHTYGFTEPPESEPGVDRLNFRRVELIRAIMIAHGDADKPVAITETGWNDHPRWTKAVSPAERIRYTLSSYEYTADQLPYVDVLCQWVLRYPSPTLSYPDNFTFLTADFRPRPIYTYLQAYARRGEITQP